MTRTNPQRLTLIIGLMLAALLGVLPVASSANAATTFTVTSTADPGDGRCDSTCTLREAITAANVAAGADTIRFDIPGSGVRTISPTSELPAITETVTIDGYSQPGSSVNTLDKGTNAVLRVELDGTLAGDSAGGLQVDIGASNVAVRGLAINRFEFAGVQIRGNSNRVEGNFIGTNASGTQDRGNDRFGGVIVNGDSNTIGGTSRFQRNLISGNTDGVDLNTNAEANKVQNNLIGTEKDGTSDLGNDFVGVAIVDAERNFIGGNGLGESNTIAFNGGDGVEVVSFVSNLDAKANRILGNSIFCNGGLGIDLRGGTENAQGATRNDPGDADAGVNDLQNKPVLTSAKTVSGETTILGRLDSTPRKPMFVEFYSNPSGNEGKKLIGARSVSTNADGVAAFELIRSQAVPAGQKITATATDVVGGNTSEFSTPRTVLAR